MNATSRLEALRWRVRTKQAPTMATKRSPKGKSELKRRPASTTNEPVAPPIEPRLRPSASGAEKQAGVGLSKRKAPQQQVGFGRGTKMRKMPPAPQAHGDNEFRIEAATSDYQRSNFIIGSSSSSSAMMVSIPNAPRAVPTQRQRTEEQGSSWKPPPAREVRVQKHLLAERAASNSVQEQLRVERAASNRHSAACHAAGHGVHGFGFDQELQELQRATRPSRPNCEVQLRTEPQRPATPTAAADQVHESEPPMITIADEPARKGALRKRPDAIPCRILPFSPDDMPDDGGRHARDKLNSGGRGHTPAQPKVRTVSEQEAKDQIQQELLQMDMSASEAHAALPCSVPSDGRFATLATYTSCWREFVMSEAKMQVRSLDHTSPSGYLSVQLQAGVELCLLTGLWRSSDSRISIVSSPRGFGCLMVSLDGVDTMIDGTWAIGRWHRLHSYRSDEVWIRLADWNTLQVCRGSRNDHFTRFPNVIRPRSMVLITTTRGSTGVEDGVLGVGCVTRDRDGGAALQVSASTAAELQHARMPKAFVTDVNIAVSARELSAISAVPNMERSLQDQLLGGNSGSDLGQCLPEVQPPDRVLPCLQKLNASQALAVQRAAAPAADGFKLIWGPPGTGKSTTLVALINALHVREYEKIHRMLEKLVLERDKYDERTAVAKWRAAARCAPRILITASSNAAVEGLLLRIKERKLLDRHGMSYQPWGIIRVGVPNRGDVIDPCDLDFCVKELMRLPATECQSKLAEVSANLKDCQRRIDTLQKEILKFQRALPLPWGWEAQLSPCGRIKYLNHEDGPRRYATFDRPPLSLRGKTCGIFAMPQAMCRIGKLLHEVDMWWCLEGQQERLAVLSSEGQGLANASVQAKLESSFIARAHLVFATLSSAARLQHHAAEGKRFGAVVVDEAAQATEPATLVPLHAAETDLCVLVGDDRQLPPTIFSSSAPSVVTLFERLRQLGHPAELLAEQYRMAPEISAFPRAYFYEEQLQDSMNIWSSTRRRIHQWLQPMLFLNLQSSRAERSGGSWRNPEEVRLCAGVLAWIKHAAAAVGEQSLADDIGVITPYRGQQIALRHELAKQQLSHDIINTVDGYQGRECEVVVFDAVRARQDVECKTLQSGIGFLADERRLNVALTRAKSVLVVIGHAPTLVKSRAWRALIDHVHERRCLFDVPSPEALSRVLRPPSKVPKPSSTGKMPPATPTTPTTPMPLVPPMTPMSTFVDSKAKRAKAGPNPVLGLKGKAADVEFCGHDPRSSVRITTSVSASVSASRIVQKQSLPLSAETAKPPHWKAPSWEATVQLDSDDNDEQPEEDEEETHEPRTPPSPPQDFDDAQQLEVIELPDEEERQDEQDEEVIELGDEAQEEEEEIEEEEYEEEPLVDEDEEDQEDMGYEPAMTDPYLADG